MSIKLRKGPVTLGGKVYVARSFMARNGDDHVIVLANDDETLQRVFDKWFPLAVENGNPLDLSRVKTVILGGAEKEIKADGK